MNPRPTRRSRSSRRSSRCWPSSPTSCRRRATSCSSPSGTASAPSSSAAARERLHPEPRPAPARPLLSRAARRCCSRSCPTAAWWTARSSSPRPTGLDFDALQMRLHPAASRVAKLARETPSSFVAFDLLAADGTDLREAAAGRAAGRASSGCWRHAQPPMHLTPLTRDRALATEWLAAVRGRRPRRRHRQAGRRRVSAGQARDARRSSTRAPPTAWSPGSAGTRPAPASWSARCCSASTTTRAGCTTSA